MPHEKVYAYCENMCKEETMTKEQILSKFISLVTIPIGSGMDYFGTTAPDKYLFANGSEISREDYSELFEVIGTTYGSGDGETTFNLPDKRERVSIMKGDSDTLGNKVGSDSVKLTSNNLPKVSLGTVVTKVNKSTAKTWDVEKTANSVTDISTTTKTLSFGSDSPTAIDNRQKSLVCNYIIRVK